MAILGLGYPWRTDPSSCHISPVFLPSFVFSACPMSAGISLVLRTLFRPPCGDLQSKAAATEFRAAGGAAIKGDINPTYSTT